MRSAFFFLLLAGLTACNDVSDLSLKPDEVFLKFYGLEGNQEGVDMVIGPDNDYYLLGNSTMRNNKQIYVLKVDKAGDVIWQKTFGGAREESAKDMELTSAGHLAIVADVQSQSGDKDILVLIVGRDGLRLDSTVYVHSLKDEEAKTITPITSGFLVAGSTRDTKPDPSGNPNQDNRIDGIILRLNSDLEPYTGIWGDGTGRAFQRGTGRVFTIHKVTQENANLYTVFAYNDARALNRNVESENDVLIFQLSNVGAEVTPQFPFGRPDENEVVTSVGRDNLTSGYAVTGISTKPNGRQDVFYLFVGVGGGTVTGGNLTLITSNLSQNQSEVPMASVVTSFGSGSFLVGATKNFMPDQTTLQGDIFLKLVDRQGSDLWRDPPAVTFGGVANDFVGNVFEGPDRRILVLGTMGIGDVQGQQKMVLIKLNRQGKFEP